MSISCPRMIRIFPVRYVYLIVVRLTGFDLI
jgi:hypothetical protein